jgi:hypothetical protein
MHLCDSHLTQIHVNLFMHQCLSHLTLVHIISLNPFNGPLIRSFNKKCDFFRILFNNKEKCDQASINRATFAKVAPLFKLMSVVLNIKSEEIPDISFYSILG